MEGVSGKAVPAQEPPVADIQCVRLRGLLAVGQQIGPGGPAPGLQKPAQLLRQWNLPSGTLGLRLADNQLGPGCPARLQVSNPFHRPADAQGPVTKIDVAPAQPAELAAPDAGVQGQKNPQRDRVIRLQQDLLQTANYLGRDDADVFSVFARGSDHGRVHHGIPLTGGVEQNHFKHREDVRHGFLGKPGPAPAAARQQLLLQPPDQRTVQPGGRIPPEGRRQVAVHGPVIARVGGLLYGPPDAFQPPGGQPGKGRQLFGSGRVLPAPDAVVFLLFGLGFGVGFPVKRAVYAPAVFAVFDDPRLPSAVPASENVLSPSCHLFFLRFF